MTECTLSVVKPPNPSATPAPFAGGSAPDLYITFCGLYSYESQSFFDQTYSPLIIVVRVSMGVYLPLR